ncbi:MAG: glycosyltransferase family 39 protein [Candidatus Uhrbacteria bacterium]|nr:glycosyltransferase family 39 protein [Candidatus Uhrbacteria bacterium]
MECKGIFSFLKKHAVWIASAFLFFVGTLVLTRFAHLFISPDETANAFFAQSFAHNGSFRVLDAMNQLYGGVLHPRSIVTDGAFLLPGSFFGLTFLYGCFSKLIGSWSLTFITPTLVVLASLAWNQILQRWFSKRIAFLSSLLFLFHPAIWYYSARGLMPNVLFVCCVVFSICFFLKMCSSSTHAQTPLLHKEGMGVVAGFFLGLALFVRLSEAYWLLPLFAVLLFAERKSLSFRRCVFGAIGFILPMCLLLFLNFKTYGSPFVFGYSFVSHVTSPLPRGELEGGLVSSEEKLSWLLPFGFHPRGIFWHTLDYLLLLFWWLTIPALCALPLVFRESKQKMYTIVTMVVALWLCIWYGSWLLHDNPDPTQITIANSYVRYWLPIFVMSTPLIAMSLQWVANRTRSKKHALHVLVSLMLLVLALNVRIVFLEGQDALVHVVSILQQSEQIRDQVFKIVPENGVIITDRSDKIFFPGRHVMVPLRSEQTYAAIPKMIDRTPVYYYGITLPATDLDFLNQQTFAPVGLHIVFIQSFGVESLYSIQRP